ncbi:MAG: exodeoxyribonuclease I, partial [Spirochaetales bacterium]|nr:exodeoxyribonuclease I [Spirochaetales bacterium]
MKSKETFFWYDLETFGLDSRHDRIAQFAGIRTDANLQEMGEPTLLYCRLSDDYLPDPLSCLITHITPIETAAKGLNESEFMGRINTLLSEPNTCTVGYNSLRFDDEFVRNGFFRNFIDPYKREYERGNSRWDILDLMRAAHDLRPEGIEWP